MRLSLIAAELKNLIAMIKSAKGIKSDSTSGFVMALKTLGDTGVSKFIEAFDNSSKKVRDAVTRMITSFTSAVKTNQLVVDAAFTSLATGGIKALRSTYSKFYDAGAYAAKGFSAGISSSRILASQAGSSLGKWALDAARRKLDEHSPSKAFYEIGTFAGQGFVNALYAMKQDAGKAGGNLGSAAMDGLSRTLSRISEAVDDNIDTQPTIRPVLDLTDIQNGSKKFNRLLPDTTVLNASNSIALASGIMRGMNADAMRTANGVGGITINNTFNEAHSRDGMAIISQLNREMGAMI